MITAIVLVTCDVSRIPEVATEIAAIEGVSEVYSVTGDADLVAMVRVRAHETVLDLVCRLLLEKKKQIKISLAPLFLRKNPLSALPTICTNDDPYTHYLT